MNVADIKCIPRDTRVSDSRTGEILRYLKYEAPYALCLDIKGVTVWLVPERLDVEKSIHG